MANYLGVTPQAISRLESETGYPDIELLPMIANFFDVTIDELLDRNILQNKNEIKEGIKEIDRLHSLGEIQKRKKLIIELYNKYPYNFELMNYYIWILAYDELKDYEEHISILVEGNEYKKEKTSCGDNNSHLDIINELLSK